MQSAARQPARRQEHKQRTSEITDHVVEQWTGIRRHSDEGIIEMLIMNVSSNQREIGDSLPEPIPSRSLPTTLKLWFPRLVSSRGELS